MTVVVVGMLKVFLAGAIRRVTEEKRMLTYLLVLGSPGLIIVDHIHFQYNGMLLGKPFCLSDPFKNIDVTAHLGLL